MSLPDLLYTRILCLLYPECKIHLLIAELYITPPSLQTDTGVSCCGECGRPGGSIMEVNGCVEGKFMNLINLLKSVCGSIRHTEFICRDLQAS